MILPLLSTAVRIHVSASSLRVVSIASSIVSWSFTGRFAFQEHAAVSGSILVYDLLP
jgi:hypothetical protein